jgi:hypothetical protein
MQLEAIYHDGKLEFCQPVRFVHGRFLVRVDVPENELIEPTTGRPKSPWAPTLAVGCAVDAIRAEVMTTPEAELQPVSDEQLERSRSLPRERYAP